MIISPSAAAEFGKARFCRADHARFGAEDFLLKREIGDLAVFGVQHGNGHRRGS